MLDFPVEGHILCHWMLFMLQFCDFTDVVIGFLMGASSTVTERVNMTVNVCPQILEGTLERAVSVYATTMDMSARGQYS